MLRLRAAAEVSSGIPFCRFLEERTGARIVIGLLPTSRSDESELFDSQAIVEVQEGGSRIFGVGGVAEAHSAFGIVGFSVEALHLVNL